MTEFHGVGRRGLYSGVWFIYRAYKKNGKYRSELAGKIGRRPEKLRCEGYQVLTQQCRGNNRETVQRLKNRVVTLYYECSRFNNGSFQRLLARIESMLEKMSKIVRVTSQMMEQALLLCFVKTNDCGDG